LICLVNIPKVKSDAEDIQCWHRHKLADVSAMLW